MATKQFVAGWALLIIGCCGNGSTLANLVIGVLGFFALLVGETDPGQPEGD